MDLSGTLSNPSLLEQLGQPARISRSTAMVAPVRLPPPARVTRTVATTIHDVLQQAATAMRVGDIHAACEAELGRSIPRSTVKGYLHTSARSPGNSIERARHGLYRRA